MSFNVVCHHIENVTLDFQTLQLKFDKLIEKEISFKLKFKKDMHNILETDYTYSTKLTNRLKEEVSTCTWIKDGGTLILSDVRSY